jgi:hypothetical protein
MFHMLYDFLRSPFLQAGFHKAAEAALHRLEQHRVLYLHSLDVSRMSRHTFPRGKLMGGNPVFQNGAVTGLPANIGHQYYRDYLWDVMGYITIFSVYL